MYIGRSLYKMMDGGSLYMNNVRFCTTTDSAIILLDGLTIGYAEFGISKILRDIYERFENVKKLHVFVSRSFKLYDTIYIIDSLLGEINNINKYRSHLRMNSRKFKVILHYCPYTLSHRKELLEDYKDNKNVFIDFKFVFNIKIDKEHDYSYSIIMGNLNGIIVNYMIGGRIPIYEYV